MTLYAGDRYPKAVAIDIATGVVDGTTVATVRVKLSTPTGELDWGTLTPTSATTTKVSLLKPLAADGASLPIPGSYQMRAWAYSAGGVELFDTDVGAFSVRANPISHP